MPVPGATSAGNWTPGQADGPAAREGCDCRCICRCSDCEGLREVGGRVVRAGDGTAFPAAATGRMCAARSACRSSWKSVLQPCCAPHERLTMFGASSVAELPSGSSSHWNAAWMPLSVLCPMSSKARAAMNWAPGAMPMPLPATITPVTSVPWPQGDRRRRDRRCARRRDRTSCCCRRGSERQARGAQRSTPVSRIPTVIPAPSTPLAQKAGAPVRAMPGSPVTASAGWIGSSESGSIERTSGRARSVARALSSAVSATASAIHSERTCRTCPSRRNSAELGEYGRLRPSTLALDLPGGVARRGALRRHRTRLEMHDDRLRRSCHCLGRKQRGAGERRHERPAHHAVRARRRPRRARPRQRAAATSSAASTSARADRIGPRGRCE